MRLRMNLMHSLYFVRISKESAKDSGAARRKAVDELNGNAFCYGDGGYFAGGRCDWFVVGGRWSGELQMLSRKFTTRVARLKSASKEGGPETAPKSAKLQALWRKIGGLGKYPDARDAYRSHGYEDDAAKITPRLLKHLQEYAQVSVYDSTESDEYLVSRLPTSSVGDWLVVIDYHA